MTIARSRSLADIWLSTYLSMLSFRSLRDKGVHKAHSLQPPKHSCSMLLHICHSQLRGSNRHPKPGAPRLLLRSQSKSKRDKLYPFQSVFSDSQLFFDDV